MKKNNLTRLTAIVLSASMVFSAVSVSAMTPEQISTTPIATASTTKDESNALATENLQPEVSNTPTVTETPQPTETLSQNHTGDEEVSNYSYTPGQSTIYATGNNATLSRSATRAASDPIDASDLSKWVVYDHYANAATATTPAATTSGIKPDDWDTTVNSDNMHPWYGSWENMGLFYDVSTVEGKEKYIQEILNGSPRVVDINQHIFTTGDQSDSTMYFVGYAYPGYLDFALTKTANDDDSLKSISFDLEAAKIDQHTISNFGFFVNAGIDENANFKGYAVHFALNGSLNAQISVTDFSNGIPVETLHNTSVSRLPGVATTCGTPFAINSGTGKYNVDIQVDNSSKNLQITVIPYSSPGVLDDKQKQVFNVPIEATGYQAFGPFVQYGSHGCTSLSYIKFGKLQLSSNLEVHFWDNVSTPSSENGTKFKIVGGIEKDQSIADTKGVDMPEAPKQNGKAFKGWNTKADGTGDWFTANTKIDCTTNVYAIWSDIGVNVSYSPDQTWTSKVDVTIEVFSLEKPKDNIIIKGDGIEDIIITPDQLKPATLDKDNTKYTYTISFDKNISNVSVSTTLPDGQGGIATPSSSINMTWIDKEAPIISDLPKGNDKGIIIAEEIKDGVKFTDQGSPGANLGGTPSTSSGATGSGATVSGIKDSSRKVYFYNEKGEVTGPISWDELEDDMAKLPTGKYTYAVSVEDNVGNYSDSTGVKVPATDKQTTKKPKVPTGPAVIINPKDATIETTLKVKNDLYKSGTWTNQEVTIDYTVNGNGIPLTSVTQSGDQKTDQKLKAPVPSYNNKIVVNKDGKYTYTIEGVNETGVATKSSVEVWIDQTAPVANWPQDGDIIGQDVFSGNTISLTDPGYEDKTGSGINEEGTVFTITPYENGKLGQPITATASGPMSTWSCDGLFKDGVTYKITLTGKDHAGNTVTKTADKILYMADPAAAKTNDQVDAWVKAIDGNIQQVNVESKTYAIKSILVTVDGKKFTEITPAAGIKEAEFLVTANAKKEVVVTITLVGGSQTTLTYTPPNYAEAKCSGKYESTNNPKHAGSGTASGAGVATPAATLTVKSGQLATNSSKGTQTFQAAVEEGFEFGGSNVDLDKVKIKYWAQRNKVGAYTAYTTTTIKTVFTLTQRNIPYNIIIEATYKGKTYYFDGTSATGKTTKPTTGGYFVQN